MKSTLLAALSLGILLIVAIIGLGSPNRVTADDPWYDTLWGFRAPVTVDAAGYGRLDKVAEIEINFTDLLEQAGETSRFDPDSIRVVEVVDGEVIDDAVPFQFDRSGNYDPVDRAEGTLLILLTGETAAASSRHYHVYFDVLGDDFTLPKFPDYVSVKTITDPYGFETFRLETINGTYHYHKTGGGFSSLFDEDEIDWIAWNPAPRGGGDFRGVPNMVHPVDGGYFHPGRASVDSGVSRRGPLRITLRSTSLDGQWATVWEVFPTYARMTVLQTATGKLYWLLYEGTPGGTLQLTTDLVTRSDGTTVTAGESWSGDIPGEEWVYFTDPGLDRSLFVIHHEEDEIIDSYTPNTDGLMTILGFGRSDNSRFLSGVGRQMTFGLTNAEGFEAVAAAIHDAYKPVDYAIGETEIGPVPPTLTPSPTPLPTDTPTITPTATATETPTATPTATATAVPTDTPTPTATPTRRPTRTPDPTETPLVTATDEPTPTATRGPDRKAYLPFIVDR